MKIYLSIILCLAGFFCLVMGWLVQPITSSAYIEEKYTKVDKWPEANDERRSAERLVSTLMLAGLACLAVGIGTTFLWNRNQSKTQTSGSLPPPQDT